MLLFLSLLWIKLIALICKELPLRISLHFSAKINSHSTIFIPLPQFLARRCFMVHLTRYVKIVNIVFPRWYVDVLSKKLRRSAYLLSAQYRSYNLRLPQQILVPNLPVYGFTHAFLTLGPWRISLSLFMSLLLIIGLTCLGLLKYGWDLTLVIQ